jgi:hypothetical protein
MGEPVQAQLKKENQERKHSSAQLDEFLHLDLLGGGGGVEQERPHGGML